ncbi:MAG TPA: hypothetical protein VGD76_06645, partial [Ramlibacter sp.]
MKKFILSAFAVAAFAIGGGAQADVIDSVGNTISRIFGIPYDPSPSGAAPVVSVYTDVYGRRFQVDAAGRHIPLAQLQPAPYGSVPPTVAVAPTFDDDGDGVANQ